MANKTYTAQEMREMADKLDNIESGYAICHYDGNDDEWRPLWMNPNSAVLALRQAAEMRERCEATIRVLDNGCHKNDVGILNYILRGDAGKKEEK